MICPHCERDTPPAESLCVHCGGALAVRFDELSESLAAQAQVDRAEEAKRRARRRLLFSIALLALVALAHALLVPPVPELTPLPAIDPAAIAPGGSRIDRLEIEPLAIPALEPVVPRGRRR